MTVGGTENLLLFFLYFVTIAVVVAYATSRLQMPYAIAMVLVGGT